MASPPYPDSSLLVADRQRAGLIEVLLVELVPVVLGLHVVCDLRQDVVLRLPAGHELTIRIHLEIPRFLGLGAPDRFGHPASFPPSIIAGRRRPLNSGGPGMRSD